MAAAAEATKSLPPKYACMLLGMTSGWYLQKHALLIIQMCLANPFVQCWVDVLKLIPCLEDHREKVVCLLEMYADQGVYGHSAISIWKKLGEYDRVDELSFARAL